MCNRKWNGLWIHTNWRPALSVSRNFSSRAWQQILYMSHHHRLTSIVTVTVLRSARHQTNSSVSTARTRTPGRSQSNSRAYSQTASSSGKSAHAQWYSDLLPGMIPVALLGSVVYLVSIYIYWLWNSIRSFRVWLCCLIGFTIAPGESGTWEISCWSEGARQGAGGRSCRTPGSETNWY